MDAGWKGNRATEFTEFTEITEGHGLKRMKTESTDGEAANREKEDRNTYPR